MPHNAGFCQEKLNLWQSYGFKPEHLPTDTDYTSYMDVDLHEETDAASSSSAPASNSSGPLLSLGSWVATVLGRKPWGHWDIQEHSHYMTSTAATRRLLLLPPHCIK